MKYMYKIMIMTAIIFVSLMEHSIASYKPFTQIIPQGASIFSYVINTPSLNGWFVAASYPENINSNVSQTFPADIITTNFPNGVWLLLNNFQMNRDLNNRNSEGAAAYYMSFAYNLYDWRGITSLGSNPNMPGNEIFPPYAQNPSPNNAIFQLTAGSKPQGNAVGTGFGTNIAVFMINGPKTWNPIQKVSLPSDTTTDLVKYTQANIKGTPVVAGLQLALSSLQEELQMILVNSNASSAASGSTLVCSLIGSKAIVNKGNLNNGVYIVLSQSLATASASTSITYNIFTRSGKSLGSGTVSLVGANQASNNGMLLFNTSFANNVYPLQISSAATPQVFLLQYPQVTATDPSATGAGATTTDAQITQLNNSIAKRLPAVTTTDSLYNAINYQKTWFASIYQSIYSPIMQAFMPGTPPPSANSVQLCIDYNKLLIAQLDAVNQYLLSQSQS